MHQSIRHLLAYLVHFGALGLLALTIADASFLFLPVGADLFTVVLVARDHDRLALYMLAAAAGSAIGALLLDLVCRTGGEKGLEHLLKPGQLTFLKQKIKQDAATVLIVACLAPPPFPFTATIAVTSALQYPRLRLLTVVFAARLVRFGLVGWAAIEFGRHILKVIETDTFVWCMGCFIAFCLIGSVFQILRWIRIGKSRG